MPHLHGINLSFLCRTSTSLFTMPFTSSLCVGTLASRHRASGLRLTGCSRHCPTAQEQAFSINLRQGTQTVMLTQHSHYAFIVGCVLCENVWGMCAFMILCSESLKHLPPVMHVSICTLMLVVVCVPVVAPHCESCSQQC